MTLTPNHPQTKYALRKARYLADLHCPITEAQHAAHRRFVDAINSGDLYAVIEAVQASRITGRRGLCSMEWREWSGDWLHRVNTLIMADIGQERAA
jgi:hypothetical protein